MENFFFTGVDWIWRGLLAIPSYGMLRKRPLFFPLKREALNRNYLIINYSLFSKLLIVKVNEADTPPKLQNFSYKSLFVNKNANGWQDEENEGFFNPVSTVKVEIAWLVLEKLYQLG
ncbi:MAG: hypothetical protein WBA93_27455 [Microcoleaceae cyanobacterium]